MMGNPTGGKPASGKPLSAKPPTGKPPTGKPPTGAPDILLRIAADRRERVRRFGAAQGLDLPPATAAPPFDFIRPPNAAGGILIAEVKRRSPSRGDIAPIPEPAVLAGRYKAAGFRRVSVLTEQERFGGSLADLVAVKKAHPDLAVLRKDFLLSVEDIEVSRRAGADAVLLIAALLDAEPLEAMYRRASELGMTVLMEVHSASDVDRVRPLAPPLLGINSRNLRNFRVEPLLPLETRSSVDWPCDIIYESGVSGPDDALFIRGAGFSGFLVGEAVARDPELAASLAAAWEERERADFLYGAWKRLYARHREGLPLVKICGICSRADAEAAADAGADIIGFVLAESPRRTTPELIRACASLEVLKAAVVVLQAGEPLPRAVADLLEEGALDFVQFHGNEGGEILRSWPGYKAVNLRSPRDAEYLETAGTPAVLVDAFSPDARGGTGRLLDEGLLEAAAERRRLWIAGGLTPENVGDIVSRWKPGLVDVSSGVEAEKGRKDHDKLRRFAAAAKAGNAARLPPAYPPAPGARGAL